MPPVIAAAASFWAALTVAEAVLLVSTVILSAGTAIYGAAQARKAERQARDAANASMKDRMVTRIATEAPHRYVYGRAKVGADIVAMFTSGDKDQYRHLVCVHAAHECDAIEEVYVNNVAVGATDMDGDPTGGRFATTPDGAIAEEAHTGPTFTLARTPRAGSVWAFSGAGAQMAPVAVTAQTGRSVTVAFTGPVLVTYEYRVVHKFNPEPVVDAPPEKAPVVRVLKHLGGANDTADAYLRSVLPDKWPATAVLRGMCYTVVTLDLNHPEFQSGLVPIHAVIRGRKLYDPRDGQTKWSENPALAVMDYLTSPLCAVPMSDLPLAQFITAANVCDEVSPTGGARYTINGTVTSDQDQKGVLEAMAQCMAGGLVATTWDVFAGKYIAPVAALTQEDIVGSLSVNPGVSDASVYNGVKGQYIGPENKHVQTDFKPYQNAAYREADGRDLYTNIDFPFTDSLQRVTNLARIFTEDQRNGFTIKAEFSLKAWPLKVGQRITFTSKFLGQTNKVYRITDKSYAPNSAVQLTMKEDAASIWDYADATVLDATPNTDLPSPWAIEPLASLSCTSGESTLLRQADGTTVPRILVTWPETLQQNGVQIEVEWRAVSSPTWERTTVSGGKTQAYLSPITPGFFYMVRARVTNPSMNVRSLAVTAVYRVAVLKATPTVYTWAASQPAPPAGKASYQWSTGTFGAAPTGWSLTKTAAPASGNVTQWAASVLVSDVDADGSAPFEWASAAVASVGATRPAWSDLAGIPYESILNNDDSVAMGFNPTFAAWTGVAPVGWASGTGTLAPLKETTIKQSGPWAVRFNTDGANNFQLNKRVNFPAPLKPGTFIAGTFNVYIENINAANTTGKPGLMFRMWWGPGSSDFNDVIATADLVAGFWQRVNFTARALAGKQITGIQVYVWGAWTSGQMGGRFNGSVIFDSFNFALYDESMDASPANAAVAAISNDNVLSKGEKSQVILEWANIGNEFTSLSSQATALGVATNDYAAKRQALADYLAGLSPAWNDTAQDTNIAAATYRSRFADYYAARQALMNAMAAKAATVSTWEGTAGRPEDVSNLVKKGDFEDGLFGTWPGGVEARVIAGSPYSKQITTRARDFLEGNTFPVTPGEVLSFSAWMCSQNTQYGTAFGVLVRDASGAVIDGIQACSRAAGLAGWALVEGKGTIAPGGVSAQPWLFQNGTDFTKGNFLHAAGLWIGRYAKGATVGAPAGTNVAGVPAETVVAKANNAVATTPGFALNAFFDNDIAGPANSTLSAGFSVNPTGYTGSYSVRWMITQRAGRAQQGPYLSNASGNQTSVTATSNTGTVYFDVTVIVTHSGGLTATLTGSASLTFGSL